MTECRSVIVMEKDASWGNTVIGKTDEGHNALKINPASFEQDEQNGTIIYPKHVMASIRDYLGISETTLSQPFSFNNTESFDFFS